MSRSSRVGSSISSVGEVASVLAELVPMKGQIVAPLDAPELSPVATLDVPQEARRRSWFGLREIALLVALYGLYSLTRSFAGDSFDQAVQFAERLKDLESVFFLDIEAGFSQLVSEHWWLGVAMSYWYETLHLVVSGGVLAWLYFRHRDRYAMFRNTLLLATAVALVLYFWLPTAPPRFLGLPFHDVVAETASAGWWPGEFGPGHTVGITNELAAFPSMHAGWSLWVALALWACAPRQLRWIGVVYALGTAIVVVGTGNHWTIDVLAGWLIVTLSAVVCSRLSRNAAEQKDPDDLVAPA